MTDAQLTALTLQPGKTADQTLVDDLGSILIPLEGEKWLPYIDSDATGIPTVGIGVNLQSYVQTYLVELSTFVSTIGPAENLVLVTDLTDTYHPIGTYGQPGYESADSVFQAQFATDMQPYGGVATLTMNDAQVKNLYYDITLGTNGTIPGYPTQPDKLDAYKKILSNINAPANFATSLEGLAAFSLYYNGGTTLLTGHLAQDLDQNNFNRPDAWFQIRYGSNGGASQSLGIAKRRYVESTLFGLYSEHVATPTPTVGDAQQIYAEFSTDTNNTLHTANAETNRQFAFNYEYQYLNGIITANSQVLGVLKPFQAGESTSQLSSLPAESLEANLQPAANVLWQQYVGDATLNPYATAYAGSNTVDSLDMQVALAQGGSDLVASQRSGYQLGTGNWMPSLLIAQGGDDTLDGSGTANDALIGGSADDAIFVGSGNDYIVAGTGDDVIGSLSANGQVGPMGSGSDTVVLGDPEHAIGGQDTVFSGSGADTYYLAAGDSDIIYLDSSPTAQPVFELVGSQGAPTPLNIDATAEPGTSGVYVDQAKNTLVLETPSADGTYSVKVIGLGSGGSSPQAKSLAISTKATETQASSSPLAGGFLELDNFQGTSDAGVTVNSGTTTTPGAGNLGNFKATVYSDHTEYQDLSGTGGGDSMDGVNTTGGNYNVLEGEGNASYIYAGDGNNDVFANDLRYSPVGDVFSNPLSVMIQGGSGDQLLVGMGEDGSKGDGKETILGGAMGTDTTAWTTIDGGGTFVDALLSGGSQNSIIFGGLGTDTIMAGSAVAGSGKPNPTTIAMSGLSFWASSSQGTEGSETVTGEPEVSIPAFSDPANFQIDVALNQLDGSYAAPFGLLGSAWDTGTDTSPWKDSSGNPISLPGSLMIGGDGEDYLIGNSGNDTLVGGTPAHPTTGVIDEVLVGAGGANVIYGGGGTELIFADLSPGADTNWANLDATDADTIYGGTGNEYIYGSGGNDVIDGGSGNYTINPGNGNTYVETGSGNTIVNGGSGNDTIIAGSGVDSIAAGTGNDSVYSGDGQSTISAGSGSDTFEAGSGTAIYNAGTGAETYQLGLGAGNQTIMGASSASSIDLTYVDGITSGDVVARCDTGNNLILTNQETGSQLEIEGYFNGESNVSVSFGDGVTWSAAQILAASMTPSDGNDELIGSNGNDTITGGPGEDTIIGVKGNNVLTGGTGDSTIYGGSGTDMIEGGAGNNQLYGGTGSETYVFNIGDGSDTITENATASGTDVLNFGAGITQSDVTFSKDSSGDLLIAFGSDSNSTITVPNFMETGSSLHQIGAFKFADGTALTWEQVFQKLVAINGTTGNDYLTGTEGADYFDGKGGNDTEFGEGGNDTFVFNEGYGALEVNENYSNGQQPVLQLGPGITASSLHVTANGTSDSNKALILTDGVNGDQITLDDEADGYNEAFGWYGIQEIQFSDGTTLTRHALFQEEIDNATTGNDTLYGDSVATYFDGKGGNDMEEGLSGNDTFVFNAGYEKLNVNEYYLGQQNSVLQFGQGITKSSLHVTGNGSDIILTDGMSGDQITLDGMLGGTYDLTQVNPVYNGIAEITFSDGTTLSRNQLVQLETTGTPGDDTLFGTLGADYFDGKGGNDVEYGYGGADTFVFNPGYGQLEINTSGPSDNLPGAPSPIIQLGAGITLPDLRVEADGENLYVTDGIAGDQIKIDGGLGYAGLIGNPPPYGAPVVDLSDGTILTTEQLVQMETSEGGTPGDDSLYGSTGNELFDGKGGNDYESGGGGNDTFVFNPGYGKLTIFDPTGINDSGSSVLKLGSGISQASLKVTENEMGDLIITDGVLGDQITIQSPSSRGYTGSSSDVQTVQFSDGSTLTQSQLTQMASNLTGTTGSDYLVGTAGADYFDGKGGDDYELGNGGADTFVFDQGYGVLDINSVSYDYTLKLGPGITASNLQAFEDSNNPNAMILTDGTNGDFVRLEGVYYDELGVVQFADGTSLTVAQLEAKFPGAYKGPEYYRLGAGSVDQTVSEGSGATSFNILYADGITSTDVSARADSAGDLTLTNRSTGSQFVVGGYFNAYQNVTVNFADSVTWGAAQLLQASMTPDDGNDYLYGSNGNDTITGGPGNDTIVGVSGANVLTGGTGNSTIEGGSGTDTIEGGKGTNEILGGTGVETYLFNVGDGSDTVTENGSSAGTDVLKLGSGILSSDVTLTHAVGSEDLEIQFGSKSASSIVISNFFAAATGGHQVGSFVFADGSTLSAGEVSGQLTDGTTLTAAQLLRMATTGTSGNDTLYGEPGADLFDGKGGNDIEIGEGGNDTFVFNSGYGQLEINESYTSGQQPMLQLGTGLTASALHVTSNGTNLMLTDGVPGDQITIDGMWSTPDDGVATVQLADGTNLTPSQLMQMEMTGTTGNDTIYGTSGDDLLDGKGGTDVEIGEGGNDTFVFNSGYGHLEINESYTSGQQPVLELGTEITASALRVTASGNNLVLTDGVSGDQITLDNEATTSSDGVAIVKLADGTTLTAAQLIQMSHDIYGTTGNDTLKGTSGAELIDGEGGTDSVIGNGGSDTFVFDSGYGSLTINEQFKSGQQPVLQLGAGITASALRVTKSGNNMVLTDGVSGDQITLINMWTNNSYGVATVQLVDGTTLTRSQLFQMEMTGTTGNDTIYGTSGADLIDGKGGSDSVVGYGGNDTFVFDSGYGHLTINEAFTSGQTPVLALGAGITASALRVTTNGTNLFLADGITGDQVTLDTMWTSSTHGVANVKLVDGTVLTRSQLIQMEMTGTTGNDTIYGTSGADLIDGKGGNDSIVGKGGNDTFVFDSGYGHLAINEAFTSGQTPVLELGTGITASALRVTTNGTNLYLADGVSGDQVTLDTMWTSSTHGVATVQLADGTTFTASQLIQMEMTGTTGNDTIYGTSGADLIDGKGGSDWVIGGGGNDTFVFDSGYGHLSINEAFTSGQAPVLELGTGITTSTLHVATSGSNLLLTDGVSGDQITLDNMATSSTNGVATVQLADGTTLTRSQLIGMEPSAVKAQATRSAVQADALVDAAASSSAGGGGGIAPPRPQDAAMPSKLSQNGPISRTAHDAALGAGGLNGTVTLPGVTVTPGKGPHVALNHGSASPRAYDPSSAGQATPPVGGSTSTSAADMPQKADPSTASGVTQKDMPTSLMLKSPANLASTALVEAGQYPQVADPAPGAPADRAMSDPDDPGIGFGGLPAIGNVGERAQGAFGAATLSAALAQGSGRRQIINTANTADDMVRALAAQGGLSSWRADGGLDAKSPIDEIRLQGGTTWSVTMLDRTMAALAPAGGALSTQTDRTHALLINAMTSFAPLASAESSPLLPPLPRDAYAMAATAQMH